MRRKKKRKKHYELHFFLLLAVVAIGSFYVGQATAVPGVSHTTGEIQAGTFAAGNYQIPGKLGVATPPSELVFDVGDRIRLRQGIGTAGLWLHQKSPPGDRAFIGMATSDTVGFYGVGLTNWGFVMNTDTGRVGIGQFPSTVPGEQLIVGGHARVTGNVHTNGFVFGQNIRAGLAKPGSDKLSVEGPFRMVKGTDFQVRMILVTGTSTTCNAACATQGSTTQCLAAWGKSGASVVNLACGNSYPIVNCYCLQRGGVAL